jgi:hypothetical protein
MASAFLEALGEALLINLFLRVVVTVVCVAVVVLTLVT